MTKRDEARRLYEDDGLTQVEIARKLDIKPATIRSWKKREKWKTKSVTQTNGHNPVSLGNLQKHENFDEGNKEAVTHGLYANHEDDPDFKKYYDQAINSIGQASLEVFAEAYANFRVAMRDIEKGKLEYIEPIAHVATMVNNAGEKAVKNKIAELEIIEREQRISGTSPVIESIREMTEGFMEYVAEAHTKDE